MTAEPVPMPKLDRSSLQVLQDYVAAEIRAAMARQRLSQSDVARRLDRPQSYVSRVYNGGGTLAVHDLAAFAVALGVTSSELIAKAEEAMARDDRMIPPMIWCSSAESCESPTSDLLADMIDDGRPIAPVIQLFPAQAPASSSEWLAATRVRVG